jgi:enoyl-CoA hydratase
MIGIERVGDVTTIELQRPERRNALNSELVDALREAVQTAAADDVRAVVITGQGTVFCAGADLSGDVFAADFPDKATALNMAVDAVPVPVIAAINGPAIGAGVQLAMVCDLRVVAPQAYFQFPIARYGLALDNWSIRRLASLAGYGRARGMLLAAEKLDADTALMTGMANRIGTLDDAQQWAAEIAGLAPLSLRHSKRVLNDDGAYQEQVGVHKEWFEAAWGSGDVIEAQVARVEKRAPRFQGA